MLLFPKPFIPISDSGFQESKERIRGATWAGGMTANSTASPENWPEIFIDSTTRTNKDSQLAVHSTVGKREPELDVSEQDPRKCWVGLESGPPIPLPYMEGGLGTG